MQLWWVMQEKEQKKEKHRMRRTEEVWNSPPATRRGAPLRSKTGDFFQWFRVSFHVLVKVVW